MIIYYKKKYHSPQHETAHADEHDIGDQNENIQRFMSIMHDCCDYIGKHGFHFTNELAEHVSREMENVDGSNHHWTVKDIKRMLLLYCNNINIDEKHLGDITYLANMAYADFKTALNFNDEQCIKYAIAVANDPDGYDGLPFSRWLADAAHKHLGNIDWSKFTK